MSSTNGDAFTAGTAEAARLAKEVQDLGFATARTIVERFVDMFAQFSGANGGGASGGGGGASSGSGSGATNADGADARPPFWFGGSETSMRNMQADMQQATDSYLSLMNQFTETSLKFFDTTRWWQPPAEGKDDLLVPRVAAGGRASARLWLHNTTATAASGLRPWCPGLTSAGGATLATTALTCQPERIERLEAGASSEVLVTVAVPDDAAPGTYHGQLLVDGLPDLAFAVRVPVQPSADR